MKKKVTNNKHPKKIFRVNICINAYLGEMDCRIEEFINQLSIFSFFAKEEARAEVAKVRLLREVEAKGREGDGRVEGEVKEGEAKEEEEIKEEEEEEEEEEVVEGAGKEEEEEGRKGGAETAESWLI